MCDKSGAAAAPLPLGTTLLPLSNTKVLAVPIPLREYFTPPLPPLLVDNVAVDPWVALILLKTSPRSVRPEALIAAASTTVTGAEVAVSGLAILEPVVTTSSTSDEASCAKDWLVKAKLDTATNESKYLIFIIFLVLLIIDSTCPQNCRLQGHFALKINVCQRKKRLFYALNKTLFN